MKGFQIRLYTQNASHDVHPTGSLELPAVQPQ